MVLLFAPLNVNVILIVKLSVVYVISKRSMRCEVGM